MQQYLLGFLVKLQLFLFCLETEEITLEFFLYFADHGVRLCLNFRGRGISLQLKHFVEVLVLAVEKHQHVDEHHDEPSDEQRDDLALLGLQPLQALLCHQVENFRVKQLDDEKRLLRNIASLLDGHFLGSFHPDFDKILGPSLLSLPSILIKLIY